MRHLRAVRTFHDDAHAQRELLLFAEHTGALYEERARFQKEMQRDLEAGRYNTVLWFRRWRGWMDRAAKEYVREFPDAGVADELFPPQVRSAAAAEWNEYELQLVTEGSAAGGPLVIRGGAKPNPVRRSSDIPYEDLLDVADVAQHWYDGQRDPIYALVSSVFAGHNVPLSIAEDAVYNLNKSWIWAEKHNPTDAETLGGAIDQLEYAILETRSRAAAMPNPIARKDYRRHKALQRDLERYYKECVTSATAKRFGSKRRASYCSGVSWKRVHVANRYPDYFKKNPHPIDASPEERKWAKNAVMQGRIQATMDLRKGVRKDHEQAIAFFERTYKMPAWAAEVAALEYAQKVGNKDPLQNPLPHIPKNVLYVGGAVVLAGIAIAIYEATKKTVPVQPPLAPAQQAAINAANAYLASQPK